MAYKYPKWYNLTPRRKRFGKAVARGSFKAIAMQCIKHPTIAKFVVKQLSTTIRREMGMMASGSILQSQNIKNIKNFSWDLILEEMKVYAPMLLQLLTGLTTTKSLRLNQKATIGTCAAILMKHRNAKMSLVQKIISMILYAGHASKQVCNCYNYHDCNSLLHNYIFTRHIHGCRN